MSVQRPPDILLRITARRRERLLSESGEASAPTGAFEPIAAGENAFLTALDRCRGRAVIAEVKMGSPRLGRIDGLAPESLAELYAAHGAAALSVVVEPDFFHGSYDLLERCRTASGLAAIAKDFIVHPAQLDRAASAGASAVLLIAALYSAEELRGWAGAARSRGLVPLVETHDEGDATKLGGAGWELVGVNNRDLRTFEVDLEHSMRQIERLPEAALKVAESGISERSDLDRLCRAGFDAFLIGESLLTAKDPAAKLEELAARA